MCQVRFPRSVLGVKLEDKTGSENIQEHLETENVRKLTVLKKMEGTCRRDDT
jgi:hypothetical protein